MPKLPKLQNSEDSIENTGTHPPRFVQFEKMTFGAKTHAPEEFWHITSQFRHLKKLPKFTPELEEFTHETAPFDPRNRVLAVLAPDFHKVKIENLIPQATAHEARMQNSHAIREQRFPVRCDPVAYSFQIGPAGAVCLRCGAAWGKHR